MADPDERWPGGQEDDLAPPGLNDLTAGAPPVVIIEDDRWRRLRRSGHLARRAASAAGGAGAVVLSSDRTVKRLNLTHRGRNKPTNVLTFDGIRTPTGAISGGDIILAYETVQREAEAAGRPVAAHMAHLIVHGALHLRGFDHGAAGDARRMEMAEARILRRLGIANPWRQGAGGTPR